MPVIGNNRAERTTSSIVIGRKHCSLALPSHDKVGSTAVSTPETPL